VTDEGQQDEVTTEHIEALLRNASEYGDQGQAQMCIAALSGNESARATCEKLIRDARLAAGSPLLNGWGGFRPDTLATSADPEGSSS
jgi:hydroxypyruvate isomerase